MIIIETTVFTKLIGQLMDDDRYRELQALLIALTLTQIDPPLLTKIDPPRYWP